MIILRQKEYTRAEREALKELLLKTRMLQRLPNGSKMTARDVTRFNKFAGNVQLWSKGYKLKKVDFENAKTFLEHADLGLSSKELEHIAKKYTNKRVLSRWQRLKGQNNLPDTIISKERRKRVVEDASANIERCKRVSSSALVKDGDSNLMASLASDAKKSNIPVVYTKNRTGVGRIVPMKDRRKKSAETREKLIKGSFYRDFKGYSKKQDKRLKSLLNDDNVSHIVILGRSSGPGIFAHELGHYKTSNISPSGRYLQIARRAKDKARLDVNRRLNLKVLHKRARQIARSLGEVANENSATSYGLANLKKLGATPEQLERIKAEVGPNGSLGAYINFNKLKVSHSL